MKTLLELIDGNLTQEDPTDRQRAIWLVGRLSPDDSTYWTYASFIYQLEGWVDETENSLLIQVADNIIQKYWDYYPRYQTTDDFIRDLKRNLASGNKKLPSIITQSFFQGLLKKYGLPNEIAPQKIPPTASDFAQIEDFLKERYVVESETGSLEGTGAGSTTSTTEGKSWDRTRPINYQTQDDTTADSVQGSSGTGKDVQETTTSQNTTRERTLSERQNSIISLVKELGDALKPLIPALVDAVAPCFVQEFSV